jgi:hypothetical protein
MSHNSNSYNISNEHLLLINILNGMYNDNLRQINRLNQNITTINESNILIRNLLTQILNNPNNRRNTPYRSNQNVQAQAPVSAQANLPVNLQSIFMNNNIPYREQYIYPLSQNNTNNSFSQLLQTFFEPIEVFPTQTQIESATRCVRFCDITSPINRECPFSLENFNDTDMVSVIRHCRHIFNTEQLNIWFMSNCRCPVCRYDIRDYNSNASNLFNANTSFVVPTATEPSQPPEPTVTEPIVTEPIVTEPIVPQNNINQQNLINNLFNITDISGNLPASYYLNIYY